MSPPVSYAKTELGYPIFCAEFDPYNRGYLVVGGGGGENNAGIANKITLLDTQDQAVVSQVGELDLSRQEDSVSSLASLAVKDGLVLYTGIGSSTADKKQGKNEHFRTFSVQYPTRPKKQEKQNQAAKIVPTSKTCLFRQANAADKQTYQALVRLSQVSDRTKPTKRLGAIATGLAPSGEIVVFDATSQSPDSKSVASRITLDKGTEPHDLDILDQGDSNFAIAYCTDGGAYLYNVSYDFSKRKAKPDESPTTLYTIPKATGGTGIPPPPRVKWLGPGLLLLLVNKNPGVELLFLQTRDVGQKANVVLRKTLPKSIRSAVSLAVCALDPDPATEERQLVIAVASGVSIHLYTINHRPQFIDPRQQLARFANFASLDDVHPVSITRVVFSNFFPPMQPAGANMSVASTPQYIQLASVTLSGSVVVETLALTSTPTSPSETSAADMSSKNDRKTQHPNVRWVLSTATTEFLRTWSGMLVLAAFALLSAVLLRSYLDLRKQQNVIADTWGRVVGGEPPFPLPRRVSGDRGGDATKVAIPTGDVADAYQEAVEFVQHTVDRAADRPEIRDLISSAAEASSVASAAAGQATQRVLVHLHDDHDDDHPEGDTSLGAASLGHDEVQALKEQGAKEYHQLSDADKQKWRRRLTRAGQWSVDEGEAVLKSILFSEYAGLVGGALRDAVIG